MVLCVRCYMYGVGSQLPFKRFDDKGTEQTSVRAVDSVANIALTFMKSIIGRSTVAYGILTMMM